MGIERRYPSNWSFHSCRVRGDTRIINILIELFNNNCVFSSIVNIFKSSTIYPIGAAYGI